MLTLPFAALLVDFGARLASKYFPNAVYLMMASGALMGTLFAVMILTPLYEMWIRRKEI